MFDLEKLLSTDDTRDSREYLESIVWEAVSGADTMEDALNGGLGALFKQALPRVADDLCAIVTRFGAYTYGTGGYRRSYRSRNPRDYYGKLVRLADNIKFDWDKFDLVTYLTMDDVRKREESYKSPDAWTTSMLIALKIDRGDKAVIDAVTDIILSENNTRAVGHELIRGVAMSHNGELHGLIVKLLLAAKLQEGLRQAVLETADDGVLDYFKLMIKTTLENDLLRFSSALRAVCVWMGMGYDYSDKRVVEKLLKLGCLYIEDEAERAAAIGSADLTQMYAGMWAESVFSIQNIQAHVERYMAGEKYQKQVGAYFLNETGSLETQIRLAGEALDETDMDVLTLILENYSLPLRNVVEGYWYRNDFQKKIDYDKYPHCLKDKATRDKHFSRLAEILEKIPKDGHTVSGKPFDWCAFVLTRDAVYTTMMALAVYDFDPAKQQRLMELSNFANGENKVDFLDYFIARDISGGNRVFLFDRLSDKLMPVRTNAVKMLKKITLDEVETVKAEELLALKTAEIRQTVLEVIRNAGNEAALSSAKRLIADKNDNKRLAALDLLSAAKKSGAIASDAIGELCAAMPK